MNNKIYDILKWVALIALPAFSLLVQSLGAVWGWAHTEQVTLTISAVSTFLGALIGVSSYQYRKEE